MERQTSAAPATTARPSWSQVLRALREMRGVTQDGWAAQLGFSRASVQRWELGVAVPDAAAEAALLALCGERGFFRTLEQGPLRGLTVTAEVLAELLAHARLGVSPGSGDPESRGSTPSESARPSMNLPAPLTSFIGRERELEEVRHLLGMTRLLTLTGTGGVGKTRLALEAARAEADQHPDGVWLVELAPLGEPALVRQTVAGALGIREQPGRSLHQSVSEWLQAKRLLLMLDNCEHLGTAPSELVETLLQSCPGLRVLATSRDVLGIGGETRYRVPSLALPSPESLPGVEQLGEYEAIQLFVERVQAVRPGFALTDSDARAVTEICRRLDGIPLALELAAARMRVLSIEQIAARLEDPFRLLTHGSRTALPRQQTLRATLDWSYDLLPEPERALLQRLTIFSGGWTVEAAEAVCPAESVDGDEVLDLLHQLADKSLVAVEESGGEIRYRLLETIREYAAAQLIESDGGALRTRHLEWYLAFVADAEPHLTGAEQATWTARLEREHDNLRAALSYSLSTSDHHEAGARLAGALAYFWEVRGHFTEGRDWLKQALATCSEHTLPIRDKILEGAGALSYHLGDYVNAEELHMQALALRRSRGDALGIARSLHQLGTVVKGVGDLVRAEALWNEALRIRRTLGEPRGIAVALTALGNVAVMQQEYDRAVALYDEASQFSRAAGDMRGSAILLHNSAAAERDRGRHARAVALYAEALRQVNELGDARMVAYCLEGLGAALGMLGHAEAAGMLYGGAAALRVGLGVPLSPGDRPIYERYRDAARRESAIAQFQAAWEAGGRLSREDVVAYGLRTASGVVASDLGAESSQ